MSEKSERAIRRDARLDLAKLTYAARRRRQGIVKSYFYLRECDVLAPATLGPLRPCARSADISTLAKESNRGLSLRLWLAIWKTYFCYT